jgi:hypothetical protein
MSTRKQEAPLDSSLCSRGIAISEDEYRATRVECGLLPHAVGRPPRRGFYNDRSAAASTRFVLCARQRDYGQDHYAARGVGCGAKRGARRRPVQLRMDRWQPVHVAQGGFGRDIRNQISRQVSLDSTAPSRTWKPEESTFLFAEHTPTRPTPPDRLTGLGSKARNHRIPSRQDRLLADDSMRLHSIHRSEPGTYKFGTSRRKLFGHVSSSRCRLTTVSSNSFPRTARYHLSVEALRR